ncbi:MAG: fibronectin type III domain-containing protein, partial [Saprospiraceae bacterium]|nr:fibronectin type III domain-containing protein [Saprospiraceae bacterium]
MPKLYHLRHFLFLLIVGLPATSVFATHNRAGEISIEQVGDCTNSLTVRATITTYTKASSRPADRDTLTICWGDGICERVARANGPGSPPQGIVLENDTKRNLYIATHTFPARGTYVISMTDPNRNGGILNVNFPNSDQIKFHIQTTYTFPNPQFQGCNNTPVLLQPPIDIGCVGQTFTHNPNAYDADGDSLSYEFIVPLQDAGVEVPNYQFPDQISPGPMNNLTIDRETGDIVWDAPQRAGEYNLAMIIVEYRDGIPIDTIIRDMQINIESCDNEPPVVETGVEEVCVVAGELLSFEVIATAPEFELGQQVRLTALGGPFEVDISPAVFEPADDAFLDDPVIKRFSWQTACEHISDQFYSVVFKATDNFFGDTTGLATLKTVRIKVVGPPPRDLSAQTEKEKVTISWALPYVCEDAANDFFRGFTVWRKINSLTFPIDTCMPGLEGRGYEKLTQVPIADQRDGRYFYEDTQVERGKTYCYRVLAQFAKTTPGGLYTYTTVESLPSGEICAQLSRDAPLITNVSVLSTSPSDGQIRVCWSKPEAEDLDTVLNPGPYRYEVLRAAGMTDNPDDFTSIGVNFVSETFAEANDTCFVDDGLASSEMPFSYLINFYVGPSEDLLGSTSGASSVFLDIVPTDRANQLSWNEVVPWNNFSYAVFRQNSSGAFEVLDTVNTSSYTDRGLENGQTYCYRIESIGSYGIAGIVDPILNFSQENCGTPIDDVPPCPPFLQVDNVCDEIDNC